MPQYTDNYGLIKPYETENYDVNVQNNNMDIIDTELKAIEDEVAGLGSELESHKDNYTQQRQQDQLKVAKVEKELNDYKATMQQVNINQEPKQKATGYGVISLPPNAAEGQVSDVKIRGITLKQELNYNRETWEEWTKSDGVVGDATGLEFTALNGINRIARINTSLKPSTKYGILYYVVYSDLTANFFISSENNEAFPFASVIPKGVGNQKAVLTTQATIVNNRVTFVTSITETTGKKIKIRDIRIFELPAGSEIENDFNTMTADQLAQKYPYIAGDSVKSTVGAVRIKSVGKNLFEPTLNGWIKDAGGTLTLNDGVFTYERTSDGNFDRIYKLFKVKPNTTYSASMNVLTLKNSVDVVIRDGHIHGEELTFFREFSTGVKKRTFTTLSDTICVILYGTAVDSYYSFKDFQIEEGAVATPYEPYRESNAYVVAADKDTGKILELRSLPNGTKDEIRASERKVIIRTNKVVIDGTEAGWVYGGMFEGMLYFYIANWGQDNNCVLGQDNWGVARNDIHTFETTSDLASGTTNFKMLVSSTGMAVAIDWEYFEANYPSTLDGFKQYLGEHPIQLIYQLAEPIEIPVHVSGALTSYPNGTVYIEPFVADAGVYTDKIEVLHDDLPIKAIKKVSKVDFMTGVETELDISKAEISEDKLSFTHPELDAGDIVFFEYEYDLESTQGETEIEYYDSRYVIKDSVTDKFYKWHIIVADGVPSIELVEV